MNQHYKQQARNAHWRDEIATECGLLTSHARGIVFAADEIISNPPYAPPCLGALDEAARVLFNAMHYINEARTRIASLPPETSADTADDMLINQYLNKRAS
jgi:hypothetical protein